MSFRTRWTQRRADWSRDIADAVRAELRALRVPDASEALLERVLASRRQGQRVLLPLEDVPRRRRGVIYLGAIAAAIALVFAIIAIRARSALPQGEGWFLGDHAYAQARAESPIYPGARVTHAERMRPMRLTYRCTERTSAASTTRDIVLSAARDAVDGAPAWRVVSNTRGRDGASQLDSVWVSAATFAPLRRTIVQAPYRRYERIEVRQEFSARGVRGEMNAYQKGAVTAHRRFDRALPSSYAPFVAEAFTPLYHAGVALDRNWTGSLAQLGWAVRDDNVFLSMAMKVDGEEVIRVPAGEFDCWRIAIDLASGRHVWYWVRKRDGLGIRSLDSTAAGAPGARETVLSAERTP